VEDVKNALITQEVEVRCKNNNLANAYLINVNKTRNSPLMELVLSVNHMRKLTKLEESA